MFIRNKIILYLFLTFIFPHVIFASDGKKSSQIAIENVNFFEKKDHFLLTGDVTVTLEETLINALGKGVTLEFISELQVFTSRAIFPDRIKNEWKRRASLTYHGITRRYYVKTEKKKVFFESLTQALAKCLSLKDWIFLEKKYFYTNNKFRVKLSLNIDSLPKPLSLVAVSDPAWKMTTGWVLIDYEE
tara:strand:+ start:1360 stop:1923 length:564 start_codon:yes stop_codon:yes gene_type:complete